MNAFNKPRPKQIDVTDDNNWYSGWCRICGFRTNMNWCESGRAEQRHCRHCRLYYYRNHTADLDFGRVITHIELERFGFCVICNTAADIPGIEGHQILIDAIRNQAIRETKTILSLSGEFNGFWKALNENQNCTTTIDALTDWLKEHGLSLSHMALKCIGDDVTINQGTDEENTFGRIGFYLPKMFDSKKKKST